MKTMQAFTFSALLVSLLSTLTIASVPSGRPPANASTAYDRAGAVFTATVVATAKDRLGFASLADVQIKQVWKGCNQLTKIVRIDGSGGPTYPARIFSPRQTYLFYLLDNPNPPLSTLTQSVPNQGSGRPVLRADAVLNRVLNLEEAASDIQYLRTKPQPLCKL